MAGHRSASPEQIRLIRMMSDEVALIFEELERGFDPNNANTVDKLLTHARLLAIAADALRDELRPRALRLVRSSQRGGA